MPKISLLLLTLLLLAFLASSQQDLDLDAGTVRLNYMRNASAQGNHILNFNKKMFDQYVMKYPRPYDVVAYFYAKQIPLSGQLFEEYNYTAQLHYSQGAVTAQVNPTFFVRIDLAKDTHIIYSYFGFTTAPNLIVSKPHMAIQRSGGQNFRQYLKDYSWRISHTDGVVNTRKMLEFINKRTGREIVYKPTQQTIKTVLLWFLGLAVAGVTVYKLLRFIWSHWLFWFIGSMLVYVVCMSGIVYCVLNGSIENEMKQKWPITFFQNTGARQQTFFEGCLISAVVSLTGLVLVIVGVTGQKVRERYSALIGVVGLVLVFYGISYIESIYMNKSFYQPSFKPPDHYLKGPFTLDQGNNI